MIENLLEKTSIYELRNYARENEINPTAKTRKQLIEEIKKLEQADTNENNNSIDYEKLKKSYDDLFAKYCKLEEAIKELYNTMKNY